MGEFLSFNVIDYRFLLLKLSNQVETWDNNTHILQYQYLMPDPILAKFVQ